MDSNATASSASVSTAAADSSSSASSSASSASSSSDPSSSSTSSSSTWSDEITLSAEQIEEFLSRSPPLSAEPVRAAAESVGRGLANGYLVVPDILSASQIDETRKGFGVPGIFFVSAYA